MTQEQFNKLKKLIALANNNPNEHEANSAARMVCKLLMDTGFDKAVLNEGPNNNVQKDRADRSSDVEDYWGAREEAARQAAKRQTSYQGYTQHTYNFKVQQINCEKCGQMFITRKMSEYPLWMVVKCPHCQHPNPIDPSI